MSGVVEAFLALAREVAIALGPRATAAGAGALGGALLALVAGWMTMTIVQAWRRRSRRVASLAARGESHPEIARRAGISRDAVDMLLRVRTTPRGRRNLPLPARIAAPAPTSTLRANRDLKLELVATHRDAAPGSRSSRSARPLPFPAPTPSSTHSFRSPA